MQAEAIRKLIDDATEKLTAALDSGRSETLTNFLAAMAKFRRYSWGNVLLIVSQRPDAAHVVGFHTWKKLGRYVRKGEKGIVIMAPMSIKPSEDRVRAAAELGKDIKPVLRFRGVYVFDVSQTDGEPLPAPESVSGTPGQALCCLRRFVAESAIQLVYGSLPPSVQGMSSGGKITLREGMTPAEEFSVLVHELAHEMLHHGTDAERGTKTIRETEAEAVAHVVGHAVGLACGRASSDYILLYNGNRETLTASLTRVQSTAASIIAAVCADADSEASETPPP